MKFTPLIILRLALGINMLMHGLVRMPELGKFVDNAAKSFEPTVLPQILVKSFLYILPFIELSIGLLILIGGRFSKSGYYFGGFLISMLIFGTTLKQDWDTAGSQLIYIIAFYFAAKAEETELKYSSDR